MRNFASVISWVVCGKQNLTSMQSVIEATFWCVSCLATKKNNSYALNHVIGATLKLFSMGQRVLGVGWGVFSLAFLWSLLLIAIIVLYRIRALLCLFLTLLVLLVTLILLVLPREEIGAYAFENVSDSMNFEQVELKIVV